MQYAQIVVHIPYLSTPPPASVQADAAAQDDASALEARVFTDLPATAIDDHGRSAVIEAGLLEVAHFTVGRERASAEAFSFIERDLRRCMGGERDGSEAEEGA